MSWQSMENMMYMSYFLATKSVPVVAASVSVIFAVSPLQTVKTIQQAKSTLQFSFAPFFFYFIQSVIYTLYAVVTSNLIMGATALLGSFMGSYYVYVYYKHAGDKVLGASAFAHTHISVAHTVAFLHPDAAIPHADVLARLHRAAVARGVALARGIAADHRRAGQHSVDPDGVVAAAAGALDPAPQGRVVSAVRHVGHDGRGRRRVDGLRHHAAGQPRHLPEPVCAHDGDHPSLPHHHVPGRRQRCGHCGSDGGGVSDREQGAIVAASAQAESEIDA